MIEVPRLKVHVLNKYLGVNDDSTTDAYLLAIDCRLSHAIKWTVYLETGAVWSNLPIEAIVCSKFFQENLMPLDDLKETHELQPFSCLEGPVSVIEYSLLKNANVVAHGLGAGNYLFTINYEGSGLAEDPEQYKTHNIIVLKNGQLAAMPNNYLRFKDNWFSYDAVKPVEYKRSDKHYFPGG